MKTLDECTADLLTVAAADGIPVSSDDNPMTASERVLDYLPSADPDSPSLPSDLRELTLLAHAAQVRGRLLLGGDDAAEGLRWLELATQAAFVSGAPTDRSDDHLILGAARHHLGDTTGAEAEFAAAHQALLSRGMSSDWSDYSPSAGDERRADLAARVVDFQFGFLTQEQPVEKREAPAHREATGRIDSALRATMSRGNQAVNRIQGKITEISESNLGQSAVDNFNQRFGVTDTQRPAPAEERGPAPMESALSALVNRPDTYLDDDTVARTRAALNSESPTDAYAAARSAHRRLEESGHHSRMGLFLARLAQEQALRLDDSAALAQSKSLVALHLRNLAQDQSSRFAAFEAATEAVQSATSLPAFPDRARAAVAMALLYVDAGQPDETVDLLVPLIDAGEQAAPTDPEAMSFLGDLYTLLSNAYSEKSKLNHDGAMIGLSHNYNRALQMYEFAGVPDGFGRARARFQI